MAALINPGRRDILWWTLRLAGLAAFPSSRSACDAAELPSRLIREFPKSRLLAISPTGDKLLVEDWDLPTYPFRVVDTVSGKTKFQGHLHSRVLDASFYSGGQSIFLRGLVSVGPMSERQQVSIDLENGNQTERVFKQDDVDRDDSYLPLHDQILLAAHRERQPYRTEFLSLVNANSYQEIQRVPYATRTRAPHPTVGGVALSTELSHVSLSDDRRYLAYSFDDVIVFRQATDLRVVWSTVVEAGLRARYLAVSADGSFVASANSDNADSRLERRFSVTVYAGQSGKEVARLALSGTAGLALRPDGAVIAVSVNTRLADGSVIPGVGIHEVPSGRKLTSVTHDEVRSGKLQALDSVITPAFTADGQYLVTAGMSTRVWRIRL